MSAVADDIGLAVYALGIAVVVLTSLGALVLRGVYNRLHFLTPATSVGAPLIWIGLVILEGMGLTTGLALLIVVLLAVSGPVLEVATGRVAGQREGLVRSESPE